MERNDRGGWIDFSTRYPEYNQLVYILGEGAIIFKHKGIGYCTMGKGARKFTTKWKAVDNKSEISCQSKCTCIDKVIEAFEYSIMLQETAVKTDPAKVSTAVIEIVNQAQKNVLNKLKELKDE